MKVFKEDKKYYITLRFLEFISLPLMLIPFIGKRLREDILIKYEESNMGCGF